MKERRVLSEYGPISKRRKYSIDRYCYIDSIPSEIVCYILSFVDITTLLRAVQVCTLWRDTLNFEFFRKNFYDGLFGDGSSKAKAVTLKEINRLNTIWTNTKKHSKAIAFFWSVGDGHTNAALRLLHSSNFTLEELVIGEPYTKTKVMALDLACYRTSSIELISSLLQKGAVVTELSLEIVFRNGNANIAHILLDRADDSLLESMRERLTIGTYVGEMGDIALFNRLAVGVSNEWLSEAFDAALQSKRSGLAWHIVNSCPFSYSMTDLLSAIRSCDCGIVRALLDRNVLHHCEPGICVKICCRHGTPEILRELINRGINAFECESALLEASTSGNVEIIEVLLDIGFDPTQVNEEGENALHLAIHESRIEAVKKLLPVTDKNADSGAHLSPIEHAIRHDNIEIIKAILDDPRPIIEGKALTLAASLDKLEIVDLLLSRGFDPNPMGSESPLRVVLSSISPERFKVAKKMVDSGASVNSVDLLVHALHLGDEAIGFLLVHGMDKSPIVHQLCTRRRLNGELRNRKLDESGSVDEKQERLLEFCKTHYLRWLPFC